MFVVVPFYGSWVGVSLLLAFSYLICFRIKSLISEIKGCERESRAWRVCLKLILIIRRFRICASLCSMQKLSHLVFPFVCHIELGKILTSFPAFLIFNSKFGCNFVDSALFYVRNFQYSPLFFSLQTFCKLPPLHSGEFRIYITVSYYLWLLISKNSFTSFVPEMSSSTMTISIVLPSV